MLSATAVPLENPLLGEAELPSGTSAGALLLGRPCQAPASARGCDGATLVGAPVERPAAVRRDVAGAARCEPVAPAALSRGAEPANTAGAGCVAGVDFAGADVAGRCLLVAGCRLRVGAALEVGRELGLRAVVGVLVGAGRLAGAAFAGAAGGGAGSAAAAGVAASDGAFAGAGLATLMLAGDERSWFPLASVPAPTRVYAPVLPGAVNETVNVPEPGTVTEARLEPPSTLIENEMPTGKLTPVIVPLSPGLYVGWLGVN
jgi:hypothetical protein